MSGQSGDWRFGRGRVGPLQAVTPTRLPGGVWGPPPASGLISFDAQGAPLNGFGAIDPVTVSSSLARAEWPLPVRWELQLYLDLQRVSYTGNPPAPLDTWPAPPGALNVKGLLQWRIESANAQQVIETPFGPGLYPLLVAINGGNGFSSTFAVVAQQIEARFTSVEGIGDPSLANSTWRYSANVLLGLTSAGWPAP